MIALDTNVVVRVLVEDDVEQSDCARSLIDRALADGATLFVPAIVVCETVWVLESAYGFPRATVADAVNWLLAAEQLTVENRGEAERALAAFADGEGDMADLLLRERARAHGAQAVATFDRALLQVAVLHQSRFTLVPFSVGTKQDLGDLETGEGLNDESREEQCLPPENSKSSLRALGGP